MSKNRKRTSARDNSPNIKRDILVIVVILLSALLLIVALKMTVKEGNKIKISVDKKHHIYEVDNDADAMYYYLNENVKINIYDEDGNVCNTVVVEDGKAYMKSANCSGQDCVHMGKISQSDQSIVCIPNKVSVEVVESDSLSEGAW